MSEKPDKPSSDTIIYWLIQDKKIDPNVFYNFLDLFWPEFINKNNYIFIKYKYSDDEFARLVREKANPEYWINLFTVDDFFPNQKMVKKNQRF